MKAHDREVAGIRCSEVLDDLTDYHDGELSPDRRVAIEAHLAGCDWCDRFGGDFADAVAALRQRLSADSGVPEGVHERLVRRWEGEEE